MPRPVPSTPLPDHSNQPAVLWLFSPIRSGSSITVYAAGAGLDCPVADEVFGPWDRTGAPYHYPPSQVALMRAFETAGHTLAPAVVAGADVLFGALARGHRTIAGEPAGLVICKHPHESIAPEDIRRLWPHHRAATLLRNPLYALNSLFVRGWDEATGGGTMLSYFSTIARRWLADPNRLVYEDLKRDPAAYFARLFAAWGLEPDKDAIARAVRYRESNYHHSSKARQAEDTGRVKSERAWRVPEPILGAYLADPLMREVFAAAGWPASRDAYPAPEPG
ncbi:MAG: hypothetical protein IPJ41_05810 [Phycisphaerales bacterium]|nr:hypothetical protein [Phycisphaerales bacterium]